MINENNKHSWCVNAFHGMSANNNGTTKMCCMIDNREETHRLGETTIQEAFNKPIFIEIRETLESGVRHSNCRRCWEEEEVGRKSKRLRDNEKYMYALKRGAAPFEGLAKFELNLGNTCNLKCRTCGPISSSAWVQEAFDTRLNQQFATLKDLSARMKIYYQTYDDESPFWDDLEANLHTIKQFDFYGGEPFMSKKTWKTLQLAVDKGYAKDIEVHYATNGTHWSPENVEVLKHFKHLNLNFSIDGIGEQFEYMRYPAMWSEVKENMAKAAEFSKLHPDVHLSWCSTVSSLNIYYLPELLEHYHEHYNMGIYLNLVHYPLHFNMSKMPEDVKEAVLAKLDTIPKSTQAWKLYMPGIIEFIRSGKYDADQWEEFKKVVKLHDDYRGQRYADVYPEFAKIAGL